ncbi:hypothetical protein I2W78_00930 [Streptomyces spinoverrucosus]|uniref:hypothetical protein n=1 Tax=Streptomyces spinoverrucosus TaxID=284043 RepID=UPI0018C3F43A|nr:hypothetical protein [Streptomyces spinoverrucosus]MBG0850455.1 hypothetical protein [Streptomyces spinoverrucosus]
MTAQTAAGPVGIGRAGVPDLDDVAGHWVALDDIAHLPSLRNQQGQGHVNHDLTSLSWLAAPPFTFGYHTGELRVDGTTPAAQRFRWKQWGVTREHRGAGLLLTTETRMALSRDLLLWHLTVTNETGEARTVELAQDLFALVAHCEVGYGWLYDCPWNHGMHHDFMALERIRATTGGRARHYLLSPAPRRLRLGRPRIPGIQRDEDDGPMLLDDALPAHVSHDKEPQPRTGVAGTVRGLRVEAADGTLTLRADGPITLTPDDEAGLDAFALSPGLTIAFELRLDGAGQSGTVLTHGNHPDSLQIGLDDGRLWLGITGEREFADVELTDGDWHRVRVDVEADHVVLRLAEAEIARTRHWTESRRWTSRVEDGTVTFADSRSPAHAAYAFAGPSAELRTEGAGGRATWTCRIEPGQSVTIGISCAYGTDPGAVSAEARAAAEDFEATLRAGEDGWRRLWTSMFTPGNPDFSGHLPTFTTDDSGLARTYYMGALQALYLRNTRIRPGEPVFLTGGPRLGPTTTYFWDHAEWSRMYALLEPAGLRSWLLRVLAGPYHDSFGVENLGGGPLGNAYSANDYALFRLIEHYVCLTGDFAFLDESTGGATVLDHLERLGLGWRDRRSPATGGVLADFGADPWHLLECVPTYTGVVASFNAAYVASTRSLAGLYRRLGRHADADRADTEAGELAEAVLDLYAGAGRWQVRRPDGTDTIGHCLDFGLVAAALHRELPQETRREMADFVTDRLLVGGWMRALSPDDPIAAASDRPDHGAAGAFAAWPGVTAHGLAGLGYRDRAVDLLRDLSSAASGGLWGQAMEIVNGPDGRYRARVAERGVATRDNIAGAAGAEAVLSALFGINPTFASGGLPAALSVEGVGRLTPLSPTDPYSQKD